MKILHGALAASVLVMLGACQATSEVVEKGKALLPGATPAQPAIATLPKEYKPSSLAIGKERDVNDYRVKGDGLVPQPVLAKYLNDLLEKIKAQSGIPNLPGTVYITANESLEAVSTADGNIFLGIGLLKNLSTEDEVVAILAHEQAHIIYGHQDADMLSTFQKKAQLGLAVVSQVQTNLSAAVEGKNPGGANLALSNNALRNLQKMQALIELTDVALLPAWSRKQEDAADALAIDISTKLGYSYSRGMKSFLELFASEEEKVDKRNAEKTAQLQAQVEEEFKKNGTLKLDNVLKDGWNTFKAMISSRHDAAVKRLETTNDYYEKFYGESPPKTRVHEAEWTQVMKGRSVTQTLNNYKLAYEADDLRVARQLPKAAQEARKAASGATADHPFPLYVLANTQLAQGDVKGLSNTLTQSLAAPEPSWRLYQLKADVELAGGRNKQARETMEAGYKRFRQPPTLHPVMIAFYKRIGDKQAMDKLNGECALESPERRESCFAATK